MSSVNEGLLEVLGESGKSSTLRILNLPDSCTVPNPFHVKLRSHFGSHGTEIIEHVIVNIIFHKVGVDAKVERFDALFNFENSVKLAKRNFGMELQSGTLEIT